MKNFDTIYNEVLREMCENLGIDVNNATEGLKANARRRTNEYIAEIYIAETKNVKEGK